MSDPNRFLNKRYLWLSAAFVLGGLLTFAFSPRSEWPIVGAVWCLAGLLVVAFASPAVRGFARDNRLATRISGLALIALSFCVLGGALALSLPIGGDLIAAVFSIMLILGLFLIQLPRSSADVESALAAQKMVEGLRPASSSFEPIEEVKETYGYIWHNRVQLLKVAGPWILLFSAILALLSRPDYWKAQIPEGRGWAILALTALAACIVIEVCLVLVASIQWTRFVALCHAPKWRDFPGKAVWGLFWRLFLFGWIFRYADKIEPWLKVHLPGTSMPAILALDRSCLFALTVLASPFALGLAPIALNEPSPSAAARTLAFGIAGRKYYLAVALILAPFSVLNFALDLLYRTAHDPGVPMFVAIFQLVLNFALIFVGTTYITRTYLKGAAAAG